MIKLKGITWDHPRGFDPLEGFSKRNALADIQVEWHKRSLKDFGDTPVEELARKYDLLIIDHPHMGAASAGSFLVNLNDYLSPDEINLLRQQSVGPSMQSYYYNEAQWAIPVDASCQVAAYRPDLLEVNDIPALWEQIPDLSKHLKTKKQYI